MRRGIRAKPNVDACEMHKAECLAGNAVLPGTIAQACEAANVPWGHVSSGCIYTGSRPDGSGFTEEDAPNFSFRQNNCSFYSGTKALGEEVLAGYSNTLHLARAHSLRPIRKPSQLSYETDAVFATPERDKFHLGAAGVRGSQPALLGEAHPFRNSIT